MKVQKRMQGCGRIALAATLWLVVVGLALAAGAGMSPRLDKLLSQGSDASASSVAAARAQYEQLKRAHPDDRRIDYAFGLVLIGQHKYHDAVSLISRYLATGQSEPHVGCAKLWAMLQAREFGAVLDESLALADRFPRAGQGPPQPAFYETAEFLGAVFGFLEHARTGAFDSPQQLERQNEVRNRLGASYMPAFDQGRASVRRQAADFQTQLDATVEAVVSRVERRKGKAKSALAQERDKLIAEEQSRQSSVEEFGDAQRRYSQLRRELSTLSQERERVMAQMIFLQAMISQAYVPTVNDQTRPTNTGPLQISVGANLEAAALAMQWATTLGRLGRQAHEMDRKIAFYRSELAAVSGKGTQEAAFVWQSEQETAAIERRARLAEQQLKRSDKSATPRTAVLSEKMSTFSSYSPFPYAQERKRVLSWFAK